ncbi:Ribonuclease p protein subunit p30 [Thalictrum thalictroides]|uniref:Ribonuclease p protein subunit p30 n=1 Tax=Thalictrum thalictroides TaxID=46969 RepID=A0A7J6XEJ8_THATH|nr:Ribonuclease p protein subunit p30 [Thalictrum thalictroides]
MGYFDLNVPYLEETAIPSPDSTTRKNNRLKIVVKAMELGYTGIAYNRSIKGIMSDKDICSITRFPLSSLLKVSPNLSTSVKFHRGLLGVPVNSPFRQYTRLTVSVDNKIQSSALNSGNKVLKTYDLVAVRPLNQVAFEHACREAQVDIIAIDFTAWVPFQIKFQSLQSALKRGVYFEITYSQLIRDAQIRKQMIHTTKLLVQWTRGKNIILSSAAASVSEIRGPCDVSNLSSLLGLSMERANAAISKNCRSLLLNSVKKKQYYKNAIKVERIPSTKSVASEEAWLCGGDDWDHISSGEGDLLLDDIAKSFAASSQISETSKAIDSSSVSDEVPSCSMQSMDWLPVSGGKVHPPPNLSAVKEFDGLLDMDQASKQLTVGFDPILSGGKVHPPPNLSAATEFGSSLDTHEVSEVLKVGVDPIASMASLASTPLMHLTSGGQDLSKLVSGSDMSAVVADDMKSETLATCFEEGKGSDYAVSVTVEMISNDQVSEGCGHEREFVTSANIIGASEQHSSDLDMISSSVVQISTMEHDNVAAMDTGKHSTPSKQMVQSSSCNGDDTRLISRDALLSTGDATMVEVLYKKKDAEDTNLILAECDMSINQNYAGSRKHGPCKNHAVSHANEKILGASFSELQADALSRAEFVQPVGASANPEVREQSKSGSHTKKRKQDMRSGKSECTTLGNANDPDLKERFIKLCLQELNNGGRSGQTLKPSSWARIGKKIKKEFGKCYSEKKLKNNLAFMRKQYHTCANLTSKIGHGYNAASNSIDWSPETWEDYQKARLEASQFRHRPFQYADEMASLFDSFVMSSGSSVPLEEPIDQLDNRVPRVLHSELMHCTALDLQSDGNVTPPRKCRKRRRTVILQIPQQG